MFELCIPIAISQSALNPDPNSNMAEHVSEAKGERSPVREELLFSQKSSLK